jgi:hypothetical protein
MLQIQMFIFDLSTRVMINNLFCPCHAMPHSVVSLGIIIVLLVFLIPSAEIIICLGRGFFPNLSKRLGNSKVGYVRLCDEFFTPDSLSVLAWRWHWFCPRGGTARTLGWHPREVGRVETAYARFSSFDFIPNFHTLAVGHSMIQAQTQAKEPL